MRFRLTVAAIAAALAACVLSLGVAGAMAAAGGNGSNSGGGSQAIATPGAGSQSTATSGPGNSSQGCDGTHHSDTGHGANQGGPYDNTCDGSPSGNGNGNGQATGKPCAGCVGNADDKNPKGQMPNGSDHNAGYECDRNHGIGRTNPAHTGCKTTTETPPAECPGGDMNGSEAGCGTPPGNGCPAGRKLGTALKHSAALALKMLAVAHPQFGELSKLADKKAKDCGEGEHSNNGNPPGGNTNPPGGNTTPEGNNTTPPAGTATPGTTPPSGATPPATVVAPDQQGVLGAREEGTSTPATTPTGASEVLGENAHGTSPAAASAPAAAQRSLPANTAGGSLPFTGTDAIMVLLLGCVMLLGGVALHRVAARRSG